MGRRSVTRLGLAATNAMGRNQGVRLRSMRGLAPAENRIAPRPCAVVADRGVEIVEVGSAL